tara:strand:+ start:303 stop:1166 length:864 start_codon:yes stop_codon:yes gene_type:complete
MAVASLLSKVVRKKRTLKDRTRETKGKTKSKRFEEIRKKADEADKKKADKADKKASSPKMVAEKKAARPARGDAKDLKKDDTPRIKRLESLKKNIGQDQKGKINRLFADKAEGNFKGKQQMLLAAGPAKGFDKAADKVKDLYDKIKSGKYTQNQYRDFVDAQAKVRDAMLRRGDANLAKNKNLTKAMLNIKPKNPADSIGGAKKGLTAKELAEKLKKLRANKAQGGMGLKMPTADQTGLRKLPTQVRNKMGYMYGGGMGKKPRMSKMDYRKGGMVIIALDMKKKGKK